MEKGTVRRTVDQVIGHRQKKKGMTVRRAAWSVKGSKVLAVLKVVELGRPCLAGIVRLTVSRVPYRMNS